MTNKLFFNGSGTNTFLAGLWVSDGTNAGTHELAVAGASADGLQPSNMVSFNNEVYFNGLDSTSPTNLQRLWVSDGTVAGTTELIVPSYQGEVNPTHLTVAGGKLYFRGLDNNENGLYVSDGTAVGTTELTITGTSNLGLNADDLVAFDDKLYFQGTDTNGLRGLWVSDGTDAGTTELAVTGASATQGLYASYSTVFAGKMFFEGIDAGEHSNLWMSDGTGAGTTELTIAGQATNGLTPYALTSVGTKLFFNGLDAAGHEELWVSDGTAVGTSELTVAGASATGLRPNSMVSFDGKLYFSGRDSDNNNGLWVSDGTAVGTHELALTGQDSGGLDPASLTVFNGQLFFSGDGPGDASDLWVSDGTAAGTHFLSPAAAAGFGVTPHSLVAVGAPVPVATDLVLAPATDSGTIGDNITNVTAPVIIGTGTPGHTVTLYDNGGTIPVGTAVVDQGGLWVITTIALTSGSHSLTATQTSPNNDVSAASAALVLTIDAIAPAAPSGLALAPASDSGTVGDLLTNVLTPVITGMGVPGDTVTLYDGTTVIGTAVVGGNGQWSVTSSTLANGVHSLTSTQTDIAGNVSAASAALMLTLAPTIIPLSAGLVDNPHNGNGLVYTELFNGAADPNVSVSISDNGVLIGTAMADATGAWSFDLAALGAGEHSLTASVAGLGGSVVTAPAVSLTITPDKLPDTRFNLTSDVVSGQFFGSDYSGPTSYLQAEYGYSGTENVFIVANVANVFLYSGTGGQDVMVAKAGSNVLDGRSGSNWMVGATGADGGTDTFFVDNRSGQVAWSSLVNFHAGDMLTLWGFDPVAGVAQFSDNMGAAGYQGTTLQATLGDGSGGVDTVTFVGLSADTAQFTTSTGTAGGVNYLAVTRIS